MSEGLILGPVKVLDSACIHRFGQNVDDGKLSVSCRLVPGVSLGKLVIDLSMPAAAEAADVQQHEQQVMGLASQLVQVCKSSCFGPCFGW